MRFIGIFLLFSCLVFTASAEDDQLDLILSNISGESGVLRPLDLEILTRMLEYADKQGKTIFELLNESFLYLQDRGLRIRLDGDDLRDLNRRFELGGRRVNTLLPVEQIDHIEIGSVLQKNQAAMEVFLFEKHSDFLELGDFYLSEQFGFTGLEEGWYLGGFGVKGIPHQFRQRHQRFGLGEVLQMVFPDFNSYDFHVMIISRFTVGERV